ncbi:hypothetical protein VNO77_26936 [Canavalia gladiata]|uniref:Uncharacterized protein n=1 Tax=Canavalia gladiata TaxID=3824 RepID=A0AAN9Q614_CANGL
MYSLFSCYTQLPTPRLPDRKEKDLERKKKSRKQNCHGGWLDTVGLAVNRRRYIDCEWMDYPLWFRGSS